jgi:hypothetical protein
MQSESLGFSLLQILSGDLPSTSSSPLLRHLVIGTILSGMVQKVFPDGKALVNFNNQNVLVNTNKKLQPGQNLTARVEQLTPHPQLKLILDNDLPLVPGRESRPSGSYGQGPDYKTQLSSPNKVSTPATFNTATLERLDLFPNQEYKARVLQVVDKQYIVLDLKGRQLQLPFIENKVPIPGSTISVKFEKIAENIFSLVRQDTIGISTPLTRDVLIPYLSAHETLPKMIANLEKAVESFRVRPLNVDPEVLVNIKKTLQQLRPTRGQLPNAEQIRQQVQVSGVNYEANVERVLRETADSKLIPELQRALKRDLKGQMLKIISSLEPLANSPGLPDIAPRNVSTLLAVFQHAVDNIELHQLSHRLALMEQEPIVLQIPNPFSPEQVVNIYVRQLQESDKDKKKKEHKGFNLVFILNMSVLGHVKIDARLQDKNLQVQIQVEKPALVKFIEGRMEELSVVMKEMGFFAEINCCLQEKVEIEFTDTISQLMIKKQTYRVDIQT